MAGRGRAAKGTRRELRIEWAPSALDKEKTVPIVQPMQKLPRLRRVNDRRSEMMRDLEVEKTPPRDAGALRQGKQSSRRGASGDERGCCLVRRSDKP